VAAAGARQARGEGGAARRRDNVSGLLAVFDRDVRDANRVEHGPDGASPGDLGGVPFTGVAPHADDHEARDLVRDVKRGQRVERVSQAARLQHHRRPLAAEIQTGRNREGFFLPRGDQGLNIAKRLVERAQNVRQGVVGDIHHAPAADGMNASAHPSGPAVLNGRIYDRRHGDRFALVKRR
jgi:hypothetical protein